MTTDASPTTPPVLDTTALDGEKGKTGYPAPFRGLVAGRSKVKLGDLFGLTNFGVNLTRLDPGASSALRHWHTKQDEFVYVVEGELTLVTDAGETVLRAGMCAGFPAGRPDGHCVTNRSDAPAAYLEIGDRTAGDESFFPDEDVYYRDGVFMHRDGNPW